MKFFLTIHRSITDPSFYGEALGFPKKNILFFILKLLLFTSLILSVLHVQRILDRKNGLPSLVPLIFPGMEITDGRLKSPGVNPYVVNPLDVARFLGIIVDEPVSTFFITDSFLVVDQHKKIEPGKNSSIRVLLSDREMLVRINPDFTLAFPYTYLVNKDQQLVFSESGVYNFLKGSLFYLFVNIFLQHTIMFLMSMASTILILAFAVFIFRMKQGLDFSTYLRIAVFGFTPVALENILVSISGVKIVWGWHVAIFISVFIIYRAISYMVYTEKKEELGED